MIITAATIAITVTHAITIPAIPPPLIPPELVPAISREKTLTCNSQAKTTHIHGCTHTNTSHTYITHTHTHTQTNYIYDLYISQRPQKSTQSQFDALVKTLLFLS